ncbi:MAG TPA: LptF/LptG family permease [bacterium]|nr:LptF/LptG family permease [bacterium]
MIKKIYRRIKDFILDAGFWIGARYIYKELIVPFLFSIGIVTFVLLINFLIREIDRLLGKDLPFGIVMEFIGLNLMHIIALSVPMAVLVACLMTYGRLSEDNEITAMRSSGISFISILRPALIFGTVVAILMIFFQNNVLPHTNHKARLLTGDIKHMRPDLKIEPGYFMDDLDQYSIYVKNKDKELLKNITIYNKDATKTQETIYADSGRIEFVGDKLLFHLFSGEIHRLEMESMDEYRIMKFKKHQVALNVDDRYLDRRTEGRRGDREMTISMMQNRADKYKGRMQKIDKKVEKLVKERLNTEPPSSRKKIPKFISKIKEQKKKELSEAEYKKEESRLNTLKNRLKAEMNLRQSYKEQVYKYRVEIHKKISMPIACIVFVLIGAPLGIMTRKGGIALASVISLLFFIIYYVFLVGGEELADETIITPFWAMWTPNILLFIAGLFMIHLIERDRKTIEFKFLKKLISKENGDEQ